MLYTFDGDAPGDGLGYSVSDAGDVDGDGVVDLIVGTPGRDDNGDRSGGARVFSGQDGSVLYTFLGDSALDFFGLAVSGAGDVDGDGFADLVVGAYGDDDNGTDSGSARIFSGRDGSVLHTFHGESAGDRFGVAVSGAGDVDADGFDDVIVGAYVADYNGVNSGRAYVLSGRDGSTLHTFDGDSEGDALGWAVSGAGDVDADGFDDLIVGIRFDDDGGPNAGSARVYSGQDGSILYTFFGDSPVDIFGASVSDAGDVDGDGFADVIVGAYADDDSLFNEGSARVFSGRDGSVLHTFFGDSDFANLGWSVSGAGDVDGDGFSDVVVGALGSGSAKVFSGVDGFLLYTLRSDSPGDRFAFSVSGAGDVNGDGFADLAVGAYFDATNGPTAGRVHVFASDPVLTVAVDVQPGDDVGCIHNDGRGVIPVAILGSADFDATQVDPSSVTLHGLTVRTVAGGSKLQAHIEDVDSDGFDDLVVQIEDSHEVFEAGDTRATLRGRLLDGTRIRGRDEMCVVRSGEGAGAGISTSFVRGDCDGDGRVATITDALTILGYTFSSAAPPSCLAACDTNGDGAVRGSAADAVYLLAFGFLGGASMPPPFPGCGPEQLDSDRALGCESSGAGCP